MRRAFIVHPLLFGLYPVLFLFSRNMQLFQIGVIVKPAAVTVGAVLAAWGVLCAAAAAVARLRSPARKAAWLVSARKSAAVVTLFVLLFFSYNPVMGFFATGPLGMGTVGFGPRCAGLAVFALIFAAGAHRALRARGDMAAVTRVLNLTSAVLVAIPLASIVPLQARLIMRDPKVVMPSSDRTGRLAAVPDIRVGMRRLPNVFYIVLDGYAREDNLKSLYHLDNSDFLNYLRSKGFYVAADSRTNYSHTYLSLASSLNMDCLSGLSSMDGDYEKVAKPAMDMIRHGRVRALLKERGYSFVALATGFYCTEIVDADTYLKPGGQHDEFTGGVLNAMPAASNSGRIARERRRILFAFDQLPRLAGTAGPTFVFAHIIAPHEPFVFGPDGGPAATTKYFGLLSANHIINKSGYTRGEYIRLYNDQLAYVNARMKELVDRLLAESPTPPVIIIQGDHGPGAFVQHETFTKSYLQDRMSILNAYYLPGGPEGLYETITPVNTFRVVFNRFLGGRFDMLPDRSYFSSINRPYDFTEVTDMIDSPLDRARYNALKDIDYYPARPPAQDATATQGTARTSPSPN